MPNPNHTNAAMATLSVGSASRHRPHPPQRRPAAPPRRAPARAGRSAAPAKFHTALLSRAAIDQYHTHRFPIDRQLGVPRDCVHAAVSQGRVPADPVSRKTGPPAPEREVWIEPPASGVPAARRLAAAALKQQDQMTFFAYRAILAKPPSTRTPSDAVSLSGLSRSLPFFSALDKDARLALMRQATLKQTPAGEAVFTAGEAADAMYTLILGAVSIREEGADGPDQSFSVGDTFGDLAMSGDDEVRSGTAVAGPAGAEAIRIPREAIERFVWSSRLKHFTAPRLRSQSSLSSAGSLASLPVGDSNSSSNSVLAPLLTPPAERTPAELDAIEALVATVPFFQSQPESARRELCRVCGCMRVRKGKTVFRVGELGDTYYVVLSGEVSVWIGAEADPKMRVADLGAGKGFGELALLADSGLRTATVQANVPTELLTLGKEAYLSILEKRDLQAMQETVAVLSALPPLRHWTGTMLTRLSYSLRRKVLRAGDVVFREGDDVSGLYVVRSGEVTLLRNMTTVKARHNVEPRYDRALTRADLQAAVNMAPVEVMQRRLPMPVVRVLQGDVVGDIEVADRLPSRLYSAVVATESAELLFLPRHDYALRMDPVARRMFKAMAAAKSRFWKLRLTEISEAVHGPVDDGDDDGYGDGLAIDDATGLLVQKDRGSSSKIVMDFLAPTPCIPSELVPKPAPPAPVSFTPFERPKSASRARLAELAQPRRRHRVNPDPPSRRDEQQLTNGLVALALAGVEAGDLEGGSARPLQQRRRRPTSAAAVLSARAVRSVIVI